MPRLDLAALVANRTMSAEMAAVLEAVGRERRSFLTVAIPRLAGKSTVMSAVLECAPRGTEMRVLTTPREFEDAATAPPSGYLVIPEVSPYPVMPGYLWGDPVRRAFALLERGYALATALHAPGLEEAFAELCQGNGVSDEHAARLEFMIYIRSLGRWQSPHRRVIASIHQVTGVREGIPEARLLHRWDEERDVFESVEPPLGLADEAALSAAAARFAA